MSDAKVDTGIFKAYDIRGIYPTSLNEEIAYRIGRAYCELIKGENQGGKLKVVVGNDMRLSVPQIKKATIAGVVDSGVDVVEAGLVTTPTYYFAVAHGQYNGGLQVSASHNPSEWIGFKLVRAGAVPVSGDTGMYKIRDMVVANKFPKVEEKGKVEEKKGVVDEAVKYELTEWPVDVNKIRPLKIVVDTANAMGALDVEAMFKDLPCELVKLNWELDGSFPVHEADPLKEENLKWTQEGVRKYQADLGIAIDGDGDRYFFVDENGEVIRQEILRGIMAQLALKKYPGAKVCYDIRPGRITRDMIEEAEGKPVVTKVGHSLIKEKMIEVGAVFSGESSGHYYYKFSFGSFDAPMVLTLHFLQFISGQDKPVSEIIKPYQKYHHSGEINSLVEDKEGKIKELAEKYRDADEINYLDGVTIEYEDWWFNVRPSNTENKLRLNLEAQTEELMEEKRDEVLGVIRG